MMKLALPFILILGFLSHGENFDPASKECLQLRQRTAELQALLKNTIEQTRIKDKIPAITYSVFTEKCFITADQSGDSGNPRSPLSSTQTLFRVASISKLFTVISAAQLMERGAFAPNTPILALKKVPFVQYLLRYETRNRLRFWAQITVADLMSHQSGISKDLPGANLFSDTSGLAQNSYPTLREFYAGLFKTEFLFEAGHVSSGIKYSNLGMNLVARIVEAYNDENLSFPEYVRRHILVPLKMNHTFYDIPKNLQNDLVVSYGALLPNQTRTVSPKPFYVGSYDGSIGVASTAADLALLGMELMRMANGNPTLLKNQNLVTWLLQLKSPVIPAVGWASGPLWQYLPGDMNNVWYGGSGTGPSERGHVLVSLEKNLGLSILFNTKDANRDGYAKIISDTMKGFKPEMTYLAAQRISNAKEFLKNTVVPTVQLPPPTTPVEMLRKFEGTYFADLAGPAEVKVSPDGYLMLAGQKLITEDAQKGLFRYPEIPGTAGIDSNREPVVFVLDSTGKPVGARVAQVKIYRKL